MLIPNHEMGNTGQGGFTPRRVVALGSVGLLHVAVVYALIVGMTPAVVKIVTRDFFVDMVTRSAPSKPTATPPQLPILTQPTDADKLDPKLPDITIKDDDRPSLPLTGNTAHPPVSDSGATGVSSTHSTPPYPAEARLLSHQGMVLLELTISPQGDVTTANIVRSSGFAELDGSAVSWVLAHWKYKPAIQGGVSVTSRTQAAVRFDLKQVRG
jgi:protein TonB